MISTNFLGRHTGWALLTSSKEGKSLFTGLNEGCHSQAIEQYVLMDIYRNVTLQKALFLLPLPVTA